MYMVTFFIQMEISTPFVNMRWVLSTFGGFQCAIADCSITLVGFKDSSLYTWNGLAMVAVFFVGRS